MLIILEGLDKTGKTTLAKKLSKKLNLTYVKVNAPKTKNAFNEYISLVRSFKINKNYILDRYHLGEMAYGQVYRGLSSINEIKQFYLESLLKSYNPILIYCWQSYNQLAWSFQKEKEEFTKFNDVPRLDKIFRAAYDRSILLKTTYRYDLDSFGSMLSFVNENRSRLVNDLKFSYLGNLSPGVLFVGDEPNIKLREKGKVNYTVFNSTSGMFLLKAIKNIKLLDFGVINSKESNQLIDASMLKKISPRVVVALGRNASIRLKDLGIKFNMVVHPQYAKRFYGKIAELRYSSEIKEAIR